MLRSVWWQFITDLLVQPVVGPILQGQKKPKKKADNIQVRSKDSQVKTQLLLWIFILLKVTR
jgi:hypothetical protein